MTEQPPTEKVDPETLVLRAKPRRVIRIKRNLLIGLAGAGCIMLAVLAWLGLHPMALQPVAVAGSEKNPEKHKVSLPDQVAALPKSYDQTPVLGEKLPGDLGRPILEHRRAHGGAGVEENSRSGPATGRAEDSRTNGLFFQVAAVPPDGLHSASPVGASLSNQPSVALPSLSVGGAGQPEKISFLHATNGDATVDPHRVQSPVSPNVIMTGTVISASLITGLNSDLPGFVLAQVTADVHDSLTGRSILIPQGTRLIGEYDSVVSFGQSRALLVWKRMIMPDGSSLEIDNLPATDGEGYAGLSDKVDYHTFSLIKGVGLSSLLGMAALGGGSDDNDLVKALREATRDTANQAGQKVVDRTLNVQPSIKVRPGWPLRVIVHKDLILKPYGN